MSDQTAAAKAEGTILGRMDANITRMAEDVKNLKETAITKEVFEARVGPLQKIVFGLIALVMTLVLTSIIIGTFQQPPPQEPPVVNIIVPTAAPSPR